MSDTLLPNIIQFMKQIDPFDILPESIVKALSQQIQITYLAKGEAINLDNEQHKYLYIIRTGSVEQRLKTGVLRARLGTEDLFGFTFFDSNDDGDAKYTATAIENTLLYLIPHEAILDLFREYPQYAEHFASQAQVRLKSALDVVWSNKEKGLFIKTVSEVASDKVAVVDVSMSIQDVAAEMRIAKRSSCAVVLDNGKIVGIITDRDMTKRVIAHGVPIEHPITEVMTLAPLTVKPTDLVLHAASVMMQFNIRNLPVVDDDKIVGLLTTSHLVQNHRVQAIFLIEKIKYSDSVEALSQLNSERQAIFEALVGGNVSVEIVGKVMTMIMDAYTRRLIQIGIDKFGAPPCDFTWVVAGSHARNEVHMLSDQDSAIVLSETATEADRLYFNHLAMYVCNGLAACQYPLCPGKFMAATPKWCQPITMWEEYYKKWVASPEYERLLNISVFLEVRAVYGNAEFVEELNDCMHSKISSNREFLGMLVQQATNVNPPLGIFNNLVLEKSGDNKKALNIKKYALNLIIDLARIYGLSVKSEATGTEERFRVANEKGYLSDDAYKNIIGAYQFISQYRLNNQLNALRNGVEPNNHINPDMFGSFERKHLKDAFRIISELQDSAKVRFGNH
ncbi:putative nucleotidyltransferase substrate binding domain-containing protein [Vibrio sp. TH_r3]|uniref:putative nucleotidyltransferase substrate binding domain-containing protein n=1 Tax=Vibrio sp. TH_r3 TaxID=3082084 RepID=UPI002955BCE6|nr:putative nucleotidyltransferase substrate binding domain-containing protein [Vibrio sp. TH_r3]MDV7103840.1 putative nucleotidyltransferase substrate binding domain-containing protein [Vibrio sp. TH_r3]